MQTGIFQALWAHQRWHGRQGEPELLPDIDESIEIHWLMFWLEAEGKEGSMRLQVLTLFSQQKLVQIVLQRKRHRHWIRMPF